MPAWAWNRSGPAVFTKQDLSQSGCDAMKLAPNHTEGRNNEGRRLPFGPALPAAVLAAALLAGCNTMEGFGEDVEAGGSAIEEEAEDASE